MTEPTRSARPRRSARRPGWVLLTVLLVLAIGSSSALVFTNRVELLKLAVILALWAAVVAAFVSVIYRRQSDIDQAKVRDLKLVYDLQLDREISARREYELSVETQLRRELVSELRAQAADEVAGLRAELAALRANLEILFDADLSHRPALETDRDAARSYDGWAPTPEPAGRVTASRIDTEDHVDTDFHTDESPIIDVPEEPHPPEYEWVPPASAGGAHRRAGEAEREAAHYVSTPPVPPPTDNERTTQFSWPPGQEPPKAPEPAPPPAPEPAPPPAPEPAPVSDWQPAPAEGRWIPAGAPGSNWVAPAEKPTDNGSAEEYVGRRRAPAPEDHPQPAMSTPPPEPPRRGRHSVGPEVVDPGRPTPPPTLATESAQPPPHAEPEPPEEPPRSRHRSADDEGSGGQTVAELLARLQATPSGGGRRRRREE
ncbi:hypothetical protein H7J93_09395 [Mycobacterium barrassiae]|uniref:DUF6779 domain-containing protein n=1 Tax=Mycobacterium barrassiae TaxID=319709 RepID=UPI002265AA73|nr:DUF6779 domain-containing protein [Mycobacterium barrassiae]MCV7299849.1 hypothetical protein [Mycobacterium barrassiae]